MAPPLPPATVRRRRLQLIALGLLFLGPLLLAAALYYGGSMRPAPRAQHGELLANARPLPTAALATPSGTATTPGFLTHRWSLLTVARGGCDARCVAALDSMRLARLALDSEAARVQRVLLANPGCCGEGPARNGAAGLVTAWLDAGDGRRLLEALATATAPAGESGRIYIVDPLGNLVISYAPGTEPRELLQDLSRLLRLSTIG